MPDCYRDKELAYSFVIPNVATLKVRKLNPAFAGLFNQLPQVVLWRLKAHLSLFESVDR